MSLQKNHHFLFPQTYFGPIQNFEEDIWEEEDEYDEIEETVLPWVLMLDQEKPNPFDCKIGLFIHWTDPFS